MMNSEGKNKNREGVIFPHSGEIIWCDTNITSQIQIIRYKFFLHQYFADTATWGVTYVIYYIHMRSMKQTD